MVNKLIRKRGKILKQGFEEALKDNNIVEDRLGEQGIICIEDLIHEISHGTELFSAASEFLCPFRLNIGERRKFKKLAFSRGGDFGYRKKKINKLIEIMT